MQLVENKYLNACVEFRFVDLLDLGGALIAHSTDLHYPWPRDLMAT
jgi:hypothetical protein